MSSLVASIDYLWIIAIGGPIIALVVFLLQQKISEFQVKPQQALKSPSKNTQENGKSSLGPPGTGSPSTTTQPEDDAGLRRSTRKRRKPVVYEAAH
ncbi:unnamed protein product [Heterosigma akashiwo]